MIDFFVVKSSILMSNAEFDVYFESVGKLQRNSVRKKLYTKKSDGIKDFLAFIIVCKSFRPITFWGANFFCFFLV